MTTHGSGNRNSSPRKTSSTEDETKMDGNLEEKPNLDYGTQK